MLTKIHLEIGESDSDFLGKFLHRHDVDRLASDILLRDVASLGESLHGWRFDRAKPADQFGPFLCNQLVHPDLVFFVFAYRRPQLLAINSLLRLDGDELLPALFLHDCLHLALQMLLDLLDHLKLKCRILEE